MILGLLLMGVVIFTFTTLNSGDENADNSNPVTEQTSKNPDSVTAATTDSLSSEELSRFATIVKQSGKTADGVTADNLFPVPLLIAVV